MKDWLKKLDWKAILIGLLTLIVGADKAPDAYNAVFGEHIDVGISTPEAPAWTITARLELIKNETISGPGKPSYTFTTTDKAGEYTVVIPGYQRPTPEQVVLAAGFNPEEGQWKVVVVSEKRPPKPEEGQEPGEEEPDTE